MRTRDIDKQQLVKEKTIELLVSDGFEGFSINKLAKACNISVATLYIYYKHKEDLIKQVARELGKTWNEQILKDFHPDLSFEEGLRVQWRNRYDFSMNYPLAMSFFEQLRSSTYNSEIMLTISGHFKEAMGSFVNNAVKKGELKKMPLEVFWSVAYAPLFNLIRFHHEKKSIGGHPFKLTEKILWQTFEIVAKSLKP